MRVTNERLIADSKCVNNANTKCSSCDMNKNCSFDGYLAPDYILDLLEARELIKEMREVITNIKKDFQPGYHDCTDDGLSQCSWCDGDDILEKTKDYAK